MCPHFAFSRQLVTTLSIFRAKFVAEKNEWMITCIAEQASKEKLSSCTSRKERERKGGRQEFNSTHTGFLNDY